MKIEILAHFMEPEWKTNFIVVKRLSYKEKLRVQDESTHLSIVGKSLKTDLSSSAATFGTIIKAVIEAPWGAGNVEATYALDGELGTWVSEQVNNFNTTSEEKKNSSETSLVAETG